MAVSETIAANEKLTQTMNDDGEPKKEKENCVGNTTIVELYSDTVDPNMLQLIDMISVFYPQAARSEDSAHYTCLNKQQFKVTSMKKIRSAHNTSHGRI